jgi:hypothetical protein
MENGFARGVFREAKRGAQGASHRAALTAVVLPRGWSDDSKGGSESDRGVRGAGRSAAAGCSAALTIGENIGNRRRLAHDSKGGWGVESCDAK